MPRKTWKVKIDYDRKFDINFIHHFESFNGFRFVVIIFNLRICVQYVKENYS